MAETVLKSAFTKGGAQKIINEMTQNGWKLISHTSSAATWKAHQMAFEKIKKEEK